jgi:predicted HD superfamily hydrolase involved in NAD metabolism
MIDDALLEAAQSYAQERLSHERYAHTLRVAETAERLARLHGLDPERARLAGLLHDTAREVGKEELLRVAEEVDLDVGDFERERPILLHGPVAAELSRKDLGVDDGEVRDAVRAHTTGEPGMERLALALYVADKIEPDRNQPGVDDLRELALESLHLAARTALEGSVSHNERRGRPIHPKSLQTLEWLTSGAESPDEARV